MEDEDIPSTLTVIIDLVITYMKRVNDLLHLAALEAQLALRTLVMIAILIFVLGTILTGFWLSILAFIFFYLESLHFSTLSASAMLVGINIFTLAGILAVIYKIKENLFFQETRNQLNMNQHTMEELKNERITNEN